MNNDEVFVYEWSTSGANLQPDMVAKDMAAKLKAYCADNNLQPDSIGPSVYDFQRDAKGFMRTVYNVQVMMSKGKAGNMVAWLKKNKPAWSFGFRVDPDDFSRARSI